jgi:hypothetical protein
MLWCREVSVCAVGLGLVVSACGGGGDVLRPKLPEGRSTGRTAPHVTPPSNASAPATQSFVPPQAQAQPRPAEPAAVAPARPASAAPPTTSSASSASARPLALPTPATHGAAEDAAWAYFRTTLAPQLAVSGEPFERELLANAHVSVTLFSREMPGIDARVLRPIREPRRTGPRLEIDVPKRRRFCVIRFARGALPDLLPRGAASIS